VASPLRVYVAKTSLEEAGRAPDVYWYHPFQLPWSWQQQGLRLYEVTITAKLYRPKRKTKGKVRP
jgi:hypothetical protein